MDVEQLRAFVAVAEELHFGRAAERLHMAQPPMSRTIQRLERDLGTPLFERTTRAVSLTPAGTALLPLAEDILRSIERARTVVEEAASGHAGTVRIAFAGASTHLRLASLARAVREELPGIDLQLLSAHYADAALDKLARREIDIAIGRWTVVPEAVAVRPVAAERLVVAVPSDHRLASRRQVSMAALRRESFVTLPPRSGSVTTDRLQHLARRAGFVPSVVQVASDTWTLLTLVSAGVGVALTVSSVIDGLANPDLRFLEVTDLDEPILLSVAWRSDDDEPAVRAVRTLSERVLPTIAPPG